VYGETETEKKRIKKRRRRKEKKKSKKKKRKEPAWKENKREECFYVLLLGAER